jgi:hypothetical protein
MPDRLQGGVRMKIDQLFSAFLGVTTLYFLILAVFRG